MGGSRKALFSDARPTASVPGALGVIDLPRGAQITDVPSLLRPERLQALFRARDAAQPFLAARLQASSNSHPAPCARARARARARACG